MTTNQIARIGLTAVGSSFGPAGAFAGSLLGAYLFPDEMPHQKGPRIDDEGLTNTNYGAMIPKIWGTVTVRGTIIDAGPMETKKKSSGGGKGSSPGPEQTTYEQYKDYDVALAEAADGIVKIFIQEQLVYDATPGSILKRPKWLDFTFYNGSEDQLPDPTFEAIHGVDNTPAYRGLAHVVFRRLKISRFGSAALSFRFEVTRNGTYSDPSTDIPVSTDDKVDMVYNPTLDLIITSVNHGTAMPPSPVVLAAIEPTTEKVVWEYRETEDDIYDDHDHFELFSFPIFSSSGGVVTFQENKYIALISRRDDGANADARAITILRAETGIAVAKINFVDSESSVPLHSAYRTGAVLYFASIVQGTRQLWRTQIQLPEIEDLAEIPLPDGYELVGSANALAIKTGNKFTRDLSFVVAFLLKVSTGEPALSVAEDQIGGFGSGEISLPWTAPVLLPSGSDEPYAGIWDATNELFWIVENGDGSPRPRFHRLKTNGTLLPVIDWDAEFGITGTPGNGGGIPRLTRILAIDDTKAILWVVVDGVAYEWHVADPTSAPIGHSSNIGGSPIALAPFTAGFYTGTDGGVPVKAHYFDRLVGEGVSLQQMNEELIEDTELVSSDYDFSALSGVTCKGAKLTRVAPRGAAVETWRRAYMYDIVPRNGVLTAALRSSISPSATLTEDDIGAHVLPGEAPEPLEIQGPDEAELPHKVLVDFVDPDQNYEPGHQFKVRESSKGGTVQRHQLAVVLNNTEGRQVAATLLHLAHIESERYRLMVMPDRAEDVLPGDAVTLDYDGESYEMRILTASVVDGGVIEVEAARHDASVFTNYSVGGQGVARNRAVAISPATILFPLDTPALREVADDNAGFYVAASSYGDIWPGCSIYVSSDAETYSPSQSLGTAANVGFALDALGDHTPGLIDWSTLQVRLLSGSLASIDHDTLQTDGETNYAAYGDEGRLEIVRFLSATQDADGIWQVSKFERGLLGTEDAVALHEGSDFFIVLDKTAIVRIGGEIADKGSPKYLKGVTIGNSVVETPPIVFVPQARSLLPFMPAALDAQRSGNDWTLSCQRRDRIRTRLAQQPPLSESPESYSWQIIGIDGSVLSTHVTSTDIFSYTEVLQTADFGEVVDFMAWQVAQVSPLVGVGPYRYTKSGTFPSDSGAAINVGTLIESWALDDTSGTTAVGANGNDGTYNAGFLLDQPSITFDDSPCCKLFIDGFNFGHVSVPYFAALGTVEAVQFVVQVDALPNTEDELLEHINGSGWRIQLQSDGQLRWRAKNGGSFISTLQTQSAIVAGVPYHIACNFGNTAGDPVAMWVNGRQVGAGTVPSNWAYSTGALRIDGRLGCHFAKVRLHNAPLTQAEIIVGYLAALGPANYGT